MALTDKLTAIADAIRGKTGKTDALTLAQMPGEIEGIQSGSDIPDGTNVTFGNLDGNPVEREEAYVITGDVLNELGAIGQEASGRSALLTIADVIYWLNRVKFVPQGNAESSFVVSGSFETSAVGSLTEG